MFPFENYNICYKSECIIFDGYRIYKLKFGHKYREMLQVNARIETYF